MIRKLSNFKQPIIGQELIPEPSQKPVGPRYEVVKTRQVMNTATGGSCD